MTYAEWYTQYMALYKRRIAAKTRESYARLAALVAPVLGPIQLEELTPEDIQLALLAIEEAAGSRQAQLAYALVHACLRRAVRSHRLNYNPADAIDKPEHEARKGRAITGEDWQLLEPVIAGSACWALMAYAGLRRGELLALTRADVDLAKGVIHVRRQRVRVGGQLVTQTPKSAAGVRDVPIVPELAPILSRELRLLLPSARVCQCAPETLAHRWRRAQLSAGIAQPYRLHDLRHTYATRLVLAGCNLRVLQYMIGHSSYQLTADTYTHIGASDALAEVHRLAELLH